MENSEAAGYVDTEKAEWEYNGDNIALRDLLDNAVGRHLGPPQGQSGPDNHLTGERLRNNLEETIEDPLVQVDSDKVEFVERESTET